MNIIVYQKEGRYALMQRRTRFLSGLWGFYESECLSNTAMNALGKVVQHYSHFALQADVYLCNEIFEEEGFEWFDMQEIGALSLSRADRKVVELIKQIAPDQKKRHR